MMDIEAILAQLEDDQCQSDDILDELSRLCLRPSRHASVIKVDGCPIPSVLMNEARYKEMQQYKEMALLAETRIKNSKRRRLLNKVQSILDGVQTSKDTTLASSSPDSRMNNSREVPVEEAFQSKNKATNDDVPVIVPYTDKLARNHATSSSYGSNSSSGNSGLNKTVIEQDLSSLRHSIKTKTTDLISPQISVVDRTTEITNSVEPDNSSVIFDDTEVVDRENVEEVTSLKMLRKSLESDGSGTEHGPYSLGNTALDSEAQSLIGEYQSFPVPTGSKQQGNMEPVYSTQDGATYFARASTAMQAAPNIQGPYDLSVIGSGTPDNLTGNITSSYVMTGSTDLYQYMQGSLDTITDTLTLKDEVVELLSSPTPPAEQKGNQSRDRTPVRERKNSYTLLGPSPALLAAHGFTESNEVPVSQEVSPVSCQRSVQRKLDYDQSDKNPIGGRNSRTSLENAVVGPRDSLENASDIFGNDTRSSEREGKQRQLESYLQQVSQQPPSPVSQQPAGVLQPVSGGNRRISGGIGTFENMASRLTQEELLKYQSQTFEMMKLHLMKQQQKQLEVLLHQQQQDQMKLEQELQRKPVKQQLKYMDGQTRQQVDRSPGSGAPSSRNSMPPSPNQNAPRLPIQSMYQNNYETGNTAEYSKNKDRYRPSSKQFGQEMFAKFDKISATVKGYLTRRLLQTDRVQEIIKTIHDTTDFAISFQDETPIKRGVYSMQDKELKNRVVAQLRAALLEIHDIFFEISITERMQIISKSRQVEREKKDKERVKPRLSTATKKAIERKRQSVTNVENRPKSRTPTTSSPKTNKSAYIRGLRPLHGHVSPIKPTPINRKSYEVVQPRPKTAPGEDIMTQQTTNNNKAKTTRRSLYKGVVSTKGGKNSVRSPRPRTTVAPRNAWK